MAVKKLLPEPSLLDQLQASGRALWASLNPAAAHQAVDWALALPMLPRLLAIAVALWGGFLAIIIVIRFAVLLLDHVLTGGALFVDFASAQMMRLLLYVWNVIQAGALLLIWAGLLPFKLALGTTVVAVQRLRGSFARRRGPRAAPPPPPPSGEGDVLRAFRHLGLPEDCDQAAFRARVRHLRQKLNSDQDPDLPDALLQSVNEAAEVIRKLKGWRR